jgi:hypothetical protein
MSIDASILRAKVLTANLGAALGAVDVPEAALFALLGFNVFPGQQMIDSVTGQIVEVVNAGVQTVSPDAAGS